jgi:hypothetical protein
MSIIALVLGLMVAAAYYRAGNDETGSGLLWGALSLLVTGVVLFPLQGGLLSLGVAQVALLFGIGLWRVWREPD